MRKDFVKIPDSTYSRDIRSRALVNNDQSAYEEYMMKTRILSTNKTVLNTFQKELNSLKEEMSEIKTLLTKLVEKNANG